MSGGTCVLTPEPFQVDGTVVTSITFKPKDAVDFDIGALLLLVVKVIAASLNAIILVTLGQIDNINEMIVCLI